MEVGTGTVWRSIVGPEGLEELIRCDIDRSFLWWFNMPWNMPKKSDGNKTHEPEIKVINEFEDNNNNSNYS